jgi:hypothetical protein
MNVAEQAWKTKKKKMVKMAVDLEDIKSAYLLSPSFERKENVERSSPYLLS